MCWICERNGSGPSKEAQRAIAKAWKTWGRSRKDRSLCYRFDYSPGPKPKSGDWLTEPVRPEVWTPAHFAKYQARTRYNFLPGTRP